MNGALIEYEHISKIAGRRNLIFTNVKNKKEQKKLKEYGTVYEKPVSGLKFENVCILSQYSEKTLKTNDKNRFQYFVFGGILGDRPAKKRTNKITKQLKNKKMKFETRNLGSGQMPTDVAAYVAKKILDGKKLSDFKFVDNLEIEVSENESAVLPFRYVIDGNKLVINERLVGHLRKKKEF